MILWADGFDHYGTDVTKMDQYGHVGTCWAPSTVQARTGTYSLACTSPGTGQSINSGTAFRRSFPTPLTTVKIGYGFYVDGYPPSESGNQGGDARIMASFIAGSGPSANITLAMGTDGSISCYDYFAWDGGLFFTAGNVIGRSNPGVVHTAAWNHFEVLTVFDAVNGSVEVRIDEVTVLSLTGINTDHYSNGPMRQVLFSGGRDGSNVFYIDDLICSDDSGTANNDFLGDMQVFTDVPNADAATQDWAPSTGAVAYAVVDEIPPNEDTDYAEADFAGDVMGLKFPALPSNLTEIAAVIYFHRTKKTGPGGSQISQTVISNGSSDVAPTIPVTTDYGGYHDVFETDPDTGAPWLRNAVRDAELDVTRVA